MSRFVKFKSLVYLSCYYYIYATCLLFTRAQSQKWRQAREHICCVRSPGVQKTKPTATIVVEKLSAAHATSSWMIPGSCSRGNTWTRRNKEKAVNIQETEEFTVLILGNKLPHIYRIILKNYRMSTACFPSRKTCSTALFWKRYRI